MPRRYPPGVRLSSRPRFWRTVHLVVMAPLHDARGRCDSDVLYACLEVVAIRLRSKSHGRRGDSLPTTSACSSVAEHSLDKRGAVGANPTRRTRCRSSTVQSGCFISGGLLVRVQPASPDQRVPVPTPGNGEISRLFYSSITSTEIAGITFRAIFGSFAQIVTARPPTGDPRITVYGRCSPMAGRAVVAREMLGSIPTTSPIEQ